MNGWMLDDGPFSILARLDHSGWTWKPASFHLADSVAQAALKDKSGRRQSLLGQKVGGQSVVIPHVVGTTAETTLWSHLRRQPTQATRDLGEDESIALLIHELPYLVFVVLDRKAAMIALAELGPGRVASPFDYWAWLRDETIISGAAFDQLCDQTLAQDQGFPGRPVRFR